MARKATTRAEPYRRKHERDEHGRPLAPVCNYCHERHWKLVVCTALRDYRGEQEKLRLAAEKEKAPPMVHHPSVKLFGDQSENYTCNPMDGTMWLKNPPPLRRYNIPPGGTDG